MRPIRFHSPLTVLLPDCLRPLAGTFSATFTRRSALRPSTRTTDNLSASEQ
ncbi:MAG: hypothetical protein SPI30_01515 [Prevotella sp.]|nr:hypothetical protein [Prevotella sp.]